MQKTNRKNKFIVSISGGLGNQMFQYAFAKALTRLKNTKVEFDFGFYKNQNLRTPELENFRLSLPLVNEYKLFLFGLKPSRFYIRPIIKLIRSICKPEIVLEKYFNYNPDVFKSKGLIYFDGYWQSEKYFEDITAEIRSDFAFNSTNLQNTCEYEIVNKPTTVGVHIRRGDYVSNTHVKNLIGTLPISYYHKAFAEIEKQIQNPNYIFFSDDIEWVKQNFPKKNNYFYIKQSISGFNSMHLFSLCKHQIIANSSFSWWAAWLNSNSRKIVIAPKFWFVDKNMQMQAGDIIPKKWIKI